MRRYFKASTIVETLLASVIVMVSFTIIMMLFGGLMRKTTMGRDYAQMRSARDSIVAVISENGLHSEMTHNAQWGRIEIKILSMEPDFSEIESISLMSNGLTYRQTYLIHNEH